jgi:predicted component of type VI protein secretion system
MTDLTPGASITISVTKVPAEPRHRKTIERLMRLQPAVQRTLTRVAKARARKNPVNQRGGRMWVARIAATRCVKAAKGATFSLRVTPQIIPDVKAISRFVSIA